MKPNLSATLVLVLAALLPNLQAAQAATASESELHAAFDRAVWPGDIVRAADEYLRNFPAGPQADVVEAARRRAAESWKLVRSNDVRLYRAAFAYDGDEVAHQLREAALGDRRAAVRLAHAHSPEADSRSALRYVGWLQYAAGLGDERASYELALYFRRTDQPLLAAQYEARAVALGYEPMAALDNIRK